MSTPLGRAVRWIGPEESKLRSELRQARVDLVQMRAERDAQAGQARRTVIDLQAVTAERDRLRKAIERHRRRMRSQVIPEMQGPDIELWSVLEASRREADR